jgi:hypothetical protein
MNRRITVFCGLVLALLMGGIGTASASPACTSAAEACKTWIQAADSSGRLQIYRSHALDRRDPDITRAFILVHGMERNARSAFRHALAAAFLAGALDNTLIVAPHFASNNGRSCRDALAPGELNWGCVRPNRWTSGGTAANDTKITSFDLADQLLRTLANREMFPNLTEIVLVGHSAGGQFVARYAMANTVHDSLGVAVRYVASNASSYVYLDAQRPTVAAYPRDIAAMPPGYSAPLPEPLPPPFKDFGDARGCSGYDEWPYGLRNRVGYSAKLPDDVLKKQLAARPVTYLLGGLDILPLGGFDDTCPAMAQGPTRLARGLAYARHVNDKLGGAHKTLLVPLCGHDARCMFTTESALQLVFTKAGAP